MSNRIEAVVIFLACSRNGLVFNTSLHHTYTVAEIVMLLDQVSCRAFFGQARYGADADHADIFSQPRLCACAQSARREGSSVGRLINSAAYSEANHTIRALEEKNTCLIEKSRYVPRINAQRFRQIPCRSGPWGSNDANRSIVLDMQAQTSKIGKICQRSIRSAGRPLTELIINRGASNHPRILAINRLR